MRMIINRLTGVRFRILILFLSIEILMGCATLRPDRITRVYAEEGFASWYGSQFKNRTTASGETYYPHRLTAAHKTLPFNTMVKVTHLENGESIVVRINDRGPFVEDRIIDLSYEAARRIHMVNKGIAKVRLEVLPK